MVLTIGACPAKLGHTNRCNIYLNILDRLWEKYGRTHGILVRYTDDTVIICKNKKSVNHVQSLLQYIMGKLDLRLHPVKTKIINMWDGTEGFDFLGLHHRRFSKINKKGNRYGETYQYPSKKAMMKMKRTVKESINQRYLLVKTEELIKVLNSKITGWRNYYKTRNDRKWMRAIDWYILCSFCRWNNKKCQQTRKLKGLYATINMPFQVIESIDMHTVEPGGRVTFRNIVFIQNKPGETGK